MQPDAALLIAPANGCQLTAPAYATPGSAGFDLSAAIPEIIALAPRARAVIPIGFVFAIAPGYMGRIAPRSGLAAKHGIDILAGVIDSDYRGEVKVVVINHGNNYLYINPGDRIAQMVITPIVQPEIHVVTEAELGNTSRGAEGFGSSGVAAASLATFHGE